MDVIIDGVAVGRAITSVYATREDVQTASLDARELMTAIEDGPLLVSAQLFAEGWELRRSNLLRRLSEISEALTAIHETFADVDYQLALSIAQSFEAPLPPGVADGSSHKAGSS